MVEKRKIFCFVLLFCLLFSAALHSEKKKKKVNYAKYNGWKITKVTVVIKDVFPDTKSFLKKIVNSIHINTRESVVKNELLYKVGDLFNNRIVDESERNLRLIKNFIVGATKVVADVKNQTVEVIVAIQDVWSIYLNVQADGGGGVQRYNFTFGERNFLGRHYSLEAKLDINPFRNLIGQHFYIPNFAGTHWRFLEKTAFYLDKDGNCFGQMLELSIVYPLYSRRSKWGFLLQGSYDKNMEFKNTGNSIDQFEVPSAPGTFLDKKYYDTYSYLKMQIVRSFGYEVKHNYGITILSEKRSYAPYDEVPDIYKNEFSTGVLPNQGEGYTRHRISFDFTLNNFTYIKLRNFFNYNRIEDYAIGLYVKASTGVSRKFWGSDENAIYINGEISHSFFFWNNHIVKIKADYTSDFPNGGERNSIIGLYYYHYIRNLPLGFLAMRVVWQRGASLEEDEEITLGGTNGLRGYQENKFKGDRRAFLNIEYRFDPIVIDFMNLGFVLFFDCGSIWGSSDPEVKNGKLYPSVGIGLRFTFPQLNPNVFRLDFGINFGNDSTKFSDMISFGYSHAF